MTPPGIYGFERYKLTLCLTLTMSLRGGASQCPDVAIRIPFTTQIIHNCTIGERIATPVCALARNDMVVFPFRNLTSTSSIRPQTAYLPCGKPLSSPKFLHKDYNMVKITAREKVGNGSKAVVSFYVNQKCISAAPRPCGKPLWKNLWRMWKTPCFQQVFRPFGNLSHPVENGAYSPA